MNRRCVLVKIARRVNDSCARIPMSTAVLPYLLAYHSANWILASNPFVPLINEYGQLLALITYFPLGIGRVQISFFSSSHGIQVFSYIETEHAARIGRHNQNLRSTSTRPENIRSAN